MASNILRQLVCDGVKLEGAAKGHMNLLNKPLCNAYNTEFMSFLARMNIPK